MKASKSATLNQRIRSDLESRILSGEWAPGFRIPYEHELMEQYGCSRMTVNKVLTALAESGMIERRRRAGSFVARQPPHLEQVALEIPDIAMEVGSRGHQYAYRLLQRELRLADAGNAGEVELAGSEKLLAMRCLHLADGRPLALEHRLISPVGCPRYWKSISVPPRRAAGCCRTCPGRARSIASVPGVRTPPRPGCWT